MSPGNLAQLRVVTEADVYKGGTRAGVLRRLPDRTEFRYLDGYLSAVAAPVAWSLPLGDEPAVAPAAAVPAFFAGLLPEGRRLTAIRRRVGTSADDEFSILLAVGADTVGDVQVVPAGALLPDASEAPTVDCAHASFAELFERDIGENPERSSVPGIQDKVSGRLTTLPIHERSGTAILKLDPPEFPHLVENEHFFYRAAARTRLRRADATLVHDRDGVPGLLVHRFDRVVTHGRVRALAVEDACQVLGRWPGDKYVIGLEDALGGLARRCRAPGAATLELFRLVVFAYLTGNGDLHAKNLAICQDRRGEWRPAPAFDLPSTAPYGDVDLALPIEGRVRQQLSWPLVQRLGAAIGLPERLAASVVREQLGALERWSADLDQLPFDERLVRSLRRLVLARARHIAPPDRP
ncbi:MAG: type II toxin-antitoxin system HipA family toxin [Acidimicrobiales bacterium]